MIPKFGIIILLFVLTLYLNQTNTRHNLELLALDTNIYKLEKTYRSYYSKIKMQDLFDKYPKSLQGLTFGYICPGAMKTIDYLNNNDRMMRNVLGNIIKVAKN